MTDFRSDTDGDILLNPGIELTTSYEEEAAQRLGLALALNLGEWFADASYGLPWIFNPNENYDENIRYMLGSKLPDSQGFVKSTLDNYITSLPYIKSVSSTYTFDPRTRQYTYTPTAFLIEGGEITLEPFITEL